MTPRPLLVLLGTAAAAALALATAPAAFAAASGTVNTSGASLTVRSSASTSASAVGSLADGAKVSIDCQTTGTTVSGTYGTSSVWDHVPAKGGYVADAYVYTGSDGRVAPACGGTSTEGCQNGLGNPSSCAQAVAWAKAHLGTANSAYTGACDHYVGVAYGWAHSGSTSAAAHWSQVPARYKHAGSRTVPAGALAFFTGGSHGYGHVMISLGGGGFASTDAGSNGRYSAGHYNRTTIATIESSFGVHYAGWAQPWFNR